MKYVPVTVTLQGNILLTTNTEDDTQGTKKGIYGVKYKCDSLLYWRGKITTRISYAKKNFLPNRYIKLAEHLWSEDHTFNCEEKKLIHPGEILV